MMNIKKIRLFALCIAVASVLAMTIASAAGQTVRPLKLNSRLAAPVDAEEMVTQLMVKPHLKTGEKLAHALDLRDASALAKTANVNMTVVRVMSGGAHVVKLDKPVTLSQARLIADRLMKDGSVELAEPDRMMHPFATTPSDPGYTYQWHYYAPSGANLGGANLPNAWDITKGNASITVAVIDTGYRQHADLGTVLPGYDFITDPTTANDGGGRDADAQDPGDWELAGDCGVGSLASDSSWHGTHVAGTIAALMNNGIGGTGIAPNVKILPVRVLGKCGGLTSDIVDGMRWAAGITISGAPTNTHPARILNMSLGNSSACSSTMQSAVTDVINAGATLIAATGNSGTTSVGSPANCTGAIAVTAHAIDGDSAHYANIGTQTAISAPGGGCGAIARINSGCVDGSASGPAIYSLLNSGTKGPVADSYASYEGTSMATPHVAGVAALMLSMNSTLTPTQIKAYLQSSARTLPAGTTCTQSPYVGLCGAGLLDAQAALTYVINISPVISLSNASQIVSPASTVSISSTVTPASGYSITTYAWTQLTGTSVGLISNANTANATFIAPATGTYTFRLTATDSAGHSSTAAATVRVNSAPVLTGVSSKTAYVGQALNFTVGATDIDGDTVTFHAVTLPSGATLAADGTFSWPSPTLGSYSLTYYASDNDVDSSQATVNIVVSAAPPPSSSGGGSLDGSSLLALALLALCLRLYRVHKSDYSDD